METKGTPGKRRWWLSLSQMETDAMTPAHCRSENPVGGSVASHRFRKYTENVAPPFYTRDGATSLRQLLFDTWRYIAIYYFLFLKAETIAATAPIAAPMTAKIDTVTPVCCSIVGSLCFPFSAPFALPSSLPVAFPSRLSSGDVEPFEPFQAAPLLTKLLAVQARYFNAE